MIGRAISFFMGVIAAILALWVVPHWKLLVHLFYECQK